tara:strand:+ start:1482 stop:2573 length:1092 start_codon:yes stop_codon:yes gene_type:complete
MRLKQLLEYDSKDLEKAKANILDQIGNLDTSDEKGIKILDKVFKILNSEQSGTSINAAFGPPTADEDWSDSVRQGHILNVAKIISDVDADYNALMNFLKKLEKGKALDVSVFDKKHSTFNELCGGDPIAIKVLHSLMLYGKGQKRAGAGEFALALLSPKIKMAPGQGDLVINGVSTELKAETTTGGGRMGSGGPPRNDQVAVLQKYAEHIPEILEIFQPGTTGKSANVTSFMGTLNKYLPAGGKSPAGGNNTQIRQAIGTEIFNLTFGQPYATAMGKAFAQAVPEVAKRTMVVQNYEWYKSRDPFDLLVVISFKAEKLTMIRNGEEMFDAFENGGLSGGSASFIHSGQAPEVFAQMNIPGTKV